MFEKYIESDIRKNRPTATITEESLTNRFEVMLPSWLIKGKKILDLGSATGALGHWCLYHGASHYTGVEIQKPFADVSIKLLSDNYNNQQFQIINSDLINFTNSNNKQWDIVVSAGVIHGFFNPFDIIKKITELSKQYVVVETLNIHEPNNIPTINFGIMNMVCYTENNLPYQGITPLIGVRAFEVIMNEYGFVQDGEILFPKRIKNSHDAYNDTMKWLKFTNSTQRFLVRYKKSVLSSQSLETKIRNDINDNVNQRAIHYGVEIEKNNKVWKFDDDVAKRFYEEAINNIPDYQRVIDICLKLANDKFTKQSCVVDVGSAIGYTMNQFIKNGFDNVIGIESSESMIRYSQHKERVLHSTTLPDSIIADLILANWTLHFIVERKQYIINIFNALKLGGAVIITDKTAQSDVIKKLYYDFKRSNGVSDEYIRDKEEKLKGYMHCYPCEWYFETLSSVGFKNIQVINSNLGFVTFYAEK